ncbi:hypothetical protein [Marinobacter sp. C2H3]|uniref:hypothetical protein n=1 Tax=Marinobacter sp. C2H3 TaxID=3119003 RepID=UPI00300F1CEF
MSYRLTDVTDLPHSPSSLLTLVHPVRAVDIVSDVLSPYTSRRDPIENLLPGEKRGELLEQLATGERLLFDASGASPGIFENRRVTPEALLKNLPPQLTRHITEYLESGGSGAGSSPLQKSDSLWPAIEPDYVPPVPARPADSPRGTKTLDLIYRWPDGTGVTGAPYAVQGLSSQVSGVLDSDGRARVTGLADPVVDVRFGQPAKAGELAILRSQLQGELKGILAREKREGERLDESLNKLPLNLKAGFHFAAGYQGLLDGAAGLLANTRSIVSLSHIGFLGRALQSAWNATRNSSNDQWMEAFQKDYDSANKRAIVEALGFDPSQVTSEQLSEAYEAASLLVADNESREMLVRFAVDFVQAQDSMELSYVAGAMLFELVLAILLAGASGAGVAASAPRYLRKLAPLAPTLRKLAARLKVSYQTRYHYNVETGGLCESACRPKPDGIELKLRSLASRRLAVNTFEEARAALAASRKRLIARGGFAPKYTQEELLQLAQEGLDNDRFIVRLVEKRHVDGRGQPEGAMAGMLGKPDARGHVRYWSTTLDQIEPSDTCPKLIAEQIGVNYDSEASYRLVVIDKDVAQKSSGAKTFIPTFENLKKFIRDNSDNYALDADILDEIMTLTYQARYSKIYKLLGPYQSKKPGLRKEMLLEMGLNTKQITRFESRLRVQSIVGANEHFLGNGLTKHTSLSDDKNIVYGALETLTIEKNPKTFRAMTGVSEEDAEAYVNIVELKLLEVGE